MELSLVTRILYRDVIYATTVSFSLPTAMPPFDHYRAVRPTSSDFHQVNHPNNQSHSLFYMCTFTQFPYLSPEMSF